MEASTKERVQVRESNIAEHFGVCPLAMTEMNITDFSVCTAESWFTCRSICSPGFKKKNTPGLGI